MYQAEMWRVPEALVGSGRFFPAACGNEFRVTALLLEASSSRFIWGKTFGRRVSDGLILKVRDEVAEALADALDDPIPGNAGYAPTPQSSRSRALGIIQRERQPLGRPIL